jgi:hypothetical protein
MSVEKEHTIQSNWFGWVDKAIYRNMLMGIAWLVFLAVKWNDIFLPYFWDEMAAYASGVLYMYDHGISILPSALPASLSFGHPLMMHVVFSLFAKVFGPSVASLHVCNLLLTYLLSLGAYLLAYQLSKDRLLSLISFLLFLMQPMVLALSTQILLEVFLAMNTIFALLFYMRKQYVLATMFCVFGLLTKETGLVLAIAFLTHRIYLLLFDQDKKRVLKKSILFLLPFGFFFAFLLLTKATFGWYLHPGNLGNLKPNLGSILQKTWDYPLEISFKNQGRLVLTGICILALVVSIIKKNRIHFKLNSDLILLGIYCFGFVAFSGIAAVLDRYFLILLPFVVILFAKCIVYFKRFHPALLVLGVLLAYATSVFNLENKTRFTEVDLGYRHMIKANAQMLSFVNSGAFKNDTIGFAFPLQLAAVDQRFGYIKERQFKLDTTFSKTAQYRVYCYPGNMEWNAPDTQIYSLVKQFESGYAKSYLFKKRKL